MYPIMRLAFCCLPIVADLHKIFYANDRIFKPVKVELKKATAMNDLNEYAALDELIRRLNETPLLSNSEAGERHQKFLQGVTTRMIEDSETYGQATGDFAIYNQPEEAFKAEISKTDNELNEQVSRFNVGLDRWFEHGETHPPYFPWRVAIILSKRKEFDREKHFLASYCRHFWDRKGNRDEMIVARAKKKGAFERHNQ